MYLMPDPLVPDCLTDGLGEGSRISLIVYPGEKVTHIGFFISEQAVTHFAVGGEAQAVAVHAERAAD